MTQHTIKIEDQFFDAVLSGNKTFEIRFNDRGYQKGDKVLLEEINSFHHGCTGRSLRVEITYVTSYQQRDNYVVFAFKPTKNQSEEVK